MCARAQSCPTLCNPMDCSPLSSSVHGIFQARILWWVAISYSRLELLEIRKISESNVIWPTINLPSKNI